MPIIGAYQVADLNTEQRKYSKSDKVWFRARKVAPLGAILAERFKKTLVTDPKFIDFEDREPYSEGLATGNSGGSAAALSTTATELRITSPASAENWVMPGDILHFDCLDQNNSNTNILMEGENMRVVSVSGNIVTVIRSVGTSSTYAVSTADTSPLRFKRIGDAERESGTSRIAKSYAMEDAYNYIQSHEYPWDISDLEKKTKHWGTEQKVRGMKQALIAITRGIEGARIFGIRSEMTDNGKKVRTTGGILWHLNQTNAGAGVNPWSSTTDLVTGDHTSRIWVPGNDFTPQRWELFIVHAKQWGSDTKIGVHGRDFLRQLKSLYDDKIRLERTDTVMGITLNEYESQGFRIQFVYNPEMDTFPSTERGLLLLDTEYISDAYMTDIEPRYNLQDNDERAEKGDYIADMGVKMHFIPAHSAILGLNDVAS